MNKLLSRCMGVRGQVKKTRTLYMVGQTRVHVDSVNDLGDFMELEVSLICFLNFFFFFFF